MVSWQLVLPAEFEPEGMSAWHGAPSLTCRRAPSSSLQEKFVQRGLKLLHLLQPERLVISALTRWAECPLVPLPLPRGNELHVLVTEARITQPRS